MLCLISHCYANNLVIDGSFEMGIDPVINLPNNYGYWGGDVTEIVGTSNGITPLDGSSMLHFVYSYTTGPSPNYLRCDLWQVIDVTSYASDIIAGNAIAELSAFFNRVSVDSQTDTGFLVKIGAYSGPPDTFPSQREVSELLLVENYIITDDQLSTWEELRVSMVLPVNTDFLAVEVCSDENVFNDSTGIEFDGHYADVVSLTIIPEPSTLSLLSFGGLALVRKRRR